MSNSNQTKIFEDYMVHLKNCYRKYGKKTTSKKNVVTSVLEPFETSVLHTQYYQIISKKINIYKNNGGYWEMVKFVFCVKALTNIQGWVLFCILNLLPYAGWWSELPHSIITKIKMCNRFGVFFTHLNLKKYTLLRRYHK